MAYPRRCPGCSGSYTLWNGLTNLPHATISARDGGTPSPWKHATTGRVLDLRCDLCGTVFRWDYFGPSGEERLGRLVEVLRAASHRGAEPAYDPARAWRGAERRRAS